MQDFAGRDDVPLRHDEPQSRGGQSCDLERVTITEAGDEPADRQPLIVVVEQRIGERALWWDFGRHVIVSPHENTSLHHRTLLHRMRRNAEA